MKDFEPRENIENKKETWKIRCAILNPGLGTNHFTLDDGLFAVNNMEPIRQNMSYFSDNRGFFIIRQARTIAGINLRNLEEPHFDVFKKMLGTNKDFFRVKFDEDDEFADLPVLLPDKAMEANWFNWNLKKWINYLVYTQYKKETDKNYKPHEYENLLIRFAKQRLLHPDADWVGKRGAIGEMFHLWSTRWKFNEEPDKNKLNLLEEAWSEKETKGYAFIGNGPFFRTIENKTTHPVIENIPTEEEILKVHLKALAIRDSILESLQLKNIEEILGLSDLTRIHLKNLIYTLDNSKEFKINNSTEEEEDYIKYEYYDYNKHDELHTFSFPALSLQQPERNDKSHSWIRLDLEKNDPISFSYFFSPHYHNLTIEDLEYTEVEYQNSLHSIGSVAPLYLPERVCLFNFILSREQLDTNWFIENSSFNEKKFFKKDANYVINNFEFMNIFFDSQALIASLKRRQEKKHKDKFRRLIELDIRGLTVQGDKRFAILNLGQRKIGNELYYIYTGTEKAIEK